MAKIVIVGASSGLGLRIATDFASWGWQVGVAARRTAPLEELAKQFPDRVNFAQIDVTATDAVERFNDLVEKNGMDVLLMAAGVGFQNADLEIQKEISMLETNVVGFARIVSAAYKFFAATRGGYAPGRIAAITSVAGTKGIGVAAAYSASKRFQQTYLQALEQLAHNQDANVKFTDIRPGFIRTDLLDSSQDYPMLMTVDYAAPLIEHAILSGKRIATVDWRWRMLTAAWRLIPDRLWPKIPVKL